MSRTTLETSPTTLSFEKFWAWLQGHPNCIIRAGTPETVLYDDEDYHWHFAVEGVDTFVIQVIRGKRLVGEMLIAPSDVAYVHAAVPERDEHAFELVTEAETERQVAFYFVLSHGYDQDQPPPDQGRAVH